MDAAKFSEVFLVQLLRRSATVRLVLKVAEFVTTLDPPAHRVRMDRKLLTDVLVAETVVVLRDDPQTQIQGV